MIYTVHSSNVTPFLCLPHTYVSRLVEYPPWDRQPLPVPEQFLDRFTEVVHILNVSTHFEECCDISTTYMGKVVKEGRDFLIVNEIQINPSYMTTGILR